VRTVSTIYAAGLLAFTSGAIAQGQTAQNREGAISWSVPEDGGTPRDPGQIERLGPQEFRVRAVVQEGFNPLAHAVSRVDLICRNAGSAATSGRFKARWFDPRTGKFGEGFELEGGRAQEVTAPGANDYALLVEKPVAGSGR
jgi:hypothetical protein